MELTRETPAGVAFGHLLLGQLEQIRASIPAELETRDVEALHDLRVAVRRSRSTLKLGSGLLPASVEAFADELRWLGDLTTPARDFDVYLERYEEMCSWLQPAEAEALPPLRELLRERQAAGHDAVAEGLRSERFSTFERDWEARLTRLVSGDGGSAEPLGPVADARIRRTQRRVHRLGNAITDATPDEEVHRLRKRAKELRYAVELFGPLYDAARLRPLVKVLKALQDNLGSFQDSSVQRAELTSLAGELAARDVELATLDAMTHLTTHLRHAQVEARAEFAHRWAAFDHVCGQDWLQPADPPTTPSE